MKISTKGRYALRMMVDLAEHYGSGLVSLNEIAKRQDISKKYLEQIIPLMNNSGVLHAVRGAQGGYSLGKDPDKITVGDVLRLTEGSLSPVDCASESPVACDRSADCATLPVWRGLTEVITEYLDGITLLDLANEQRGMYANDYVI